MSDDEWRVEVLRQLSQLRADYGELKRDARDASRALVIAQQNALCLDDQNGRVRRIEAAIEQHSANTADITAHAAAIVALAKDDAAWRAVRIRILGAAKWFTGVAAALLLVYQMIVHGPSALREISSTIDKAMK
jgi:hypothetical protein